MHKQGLEERLALPLQMLQQACRRTTVPIGQIEKKNCHYHQWDMINKEDGWESFDSDTAFGGKDSHWIFRTTVEVPSTLQGHLLRCSVKTGATDIWNYNNPQCLAFVNRQLVCGLDVCHTTFLLPDIKNMELAFYCYASTAKPDIFLTIQVYEHKQELEQLSIDLKLALETALLMEEDSPSYLLLSKACLAALEELDLRQLEGPSFDASVRRATKVINSLVGTRSPLRVSVVGHSHIDMAWLWTLDQTREKAIRSFATVLHLMKQYPEYHYTCSQPQLLELVQKDQPQLFAQILARVSEGRWEIEGGMWVESDTILTTGESLVRQIFWGKQWIQNMTGKESKVLWLPDCFGFPATLPQIMEGCDLSYFVTSKLGWNEQNRIPHDVFTWEGLDGSSVLAYLLSSKNYEPPGVYPKNQSNETTYNGLLNSSQILGTWQRFQDKDTTNQTLHLYGYGDGGGGPTSEMLEHQRRFAQGYPGVPITTQTTVRQFFSNLEQNIGDIACWHGELYLEYHRGTYTTLVESKRLNALCEKTAMTTESLCTISWLSCLSEYPHAKLEKAWKQVLLNQFHDILPGSSIQEVYTQSHADLRQALATFEEASSDALLQLTSHLELSSEEVVVFNPVCNECSEIVSFPVKSDYSIEDLQGKLLTSWYDGSSLHFLATELPSKGWKTYRLVDRIEPLPNPFSYSEGILCTPFYELEITDDLTLRSLFDKGEGRQVLSEGSEGNVLRLYADYPAKYDSWNLGKQGLDQNWTVEGQGTVEMTACNPLFCTLSVERTYLKSTYKQSITCYAHQRRIDFSLCVDWQEDHLLLRTLFPVDVLASRASYQIAYGVCERTTHSNTSWDTAAFEVPAHRWVDVSEEGYGVALLSEHSFGYSVKNGVLSVSLVRSPSYPYEQADRGGHQFSYSLLPHKGRYQESDVVPTSYVLQYKPLVRQGTGKRSLLPKRFSAFSIEQNHVVCETVKKAEDRDSALLRLVEMDGRRGFCTVHSPYKILEAWQCNLLEQRLTKLEHNPHQVAFHIKGHQIKTLELVCEPIEIFRS